MEVRIAVAAGDRFHPAPGQLGAPARPVDGLLDHASALDGVLQNAADLVQPVIQPQLGIGGGQHVEQAEAGGVFQVLCQLVEVDPAQVPHRSADVGAVHMGARPQGEGGGDPGQAASLLSGTLEHVAGGHDVRDRSADQTQQDGVPVETVQQGGGFPGMFQRRQMALELFQSGVGPVEAPCGDQGVHRVQSQHLGCPLLRHAAHGRTLAVVAVTRRSVSRSAWT
jgi:hypothetical protein